MIRCLLTILAFLLLAQTFAIIKEPATETFPKGNDMMGRPVWYNPAVDKCEDMEGFYVNCPRELEGVVGEAK